jgi:RNA polymerase sigma-70 factor, ECF subfamily
VQDFLLITSKSPSAQVAVNTSTPTDSHVRNQIIVLLPRLRRFARGLSSSVDEAEDLVQGACERALRGIDSWQPSGRFESWMFRILRNLWIDELRRRRTERIVDNPDAGSDLPGEDGRRTVEGRLELAKVRTAMARLPEQQREVLALVCIEDLSYRDAASVLEVPIGTVMSRLARARQALAGGASVE